MSLRSLFNVDSSLSVLLHAAKALVALFLNWLVLRHFSMDDFIVWSVTSSILVVATASDLGIGQYTVTQLIGTERKEWHRHIGRGLGALVPLAAISGLFVFVALDGPSLLYATTMASLLSLRILTLPFVAVLHAGNQFKIRKALELTAYLIAVILIGVLLLAKASVYAALLTLNATFFLGFALMVLAAGRYISIGASLREMSVAKSMAVFGAALPFTMNNLTGVLTYGGFVWLSSLILPPEQVAKLAVLHTFVLVNLYQVYDVFLKARQADLADPKKVQLYSKLNTTAMLVFPPAFLAFGPSILKIIGGEHVEFTIAETALYAVFVSLELGNLFFQSTAQVRLSQAHRLKSYSATRAAMMGAFILAALLPLDGAGKLLTLLSVLAVGSLVSLVQLQRSGNRSRFVKPGMQTAPGTQGYGPTGDDL